ncbi:hypothetical protein [Rhodopirellula bahusiensis]|uniref:Uncharacterized protein n=1 Tax=Rhodopirellula bahusiensis TaxID=2014065 RepID=A0A2G1W823_9BACT|nr:hypothetical protein [Rhodopirellula bahusiensis]PHQ35182.1 hypothetical protein CEE69_12285 [Rhodopirellula bahusiensis]
MNANPNTLCRDCLHVVDTVPSDVPWHVIELSDFILIADARDEASTLILEAVASQFGQVVASESIESNHTDRGTLLGYLVKPSADLADPAGSIRAAYAIATTEATEDEEAGPF